MGVKTKGDFAPKPLGEVLGTALGLSRREKDTRRLQDLVRCWGSVAGPAARSSAPYDLIGGTLLVAARSPHAAGMIKKMKGSLQKKLKARLGLEIEEVRVTQGGPSPAGRKAGGGPRRRHPVVEPSEEEVRAFRQLCPEDMPPEVADALARLRAFFARRFPRKD